MNIYDFTVLKNGIEVPLSDYRDKVLLIVNTASKCGLTPQYEALQQLHTQYHNLGLEILDFPCNQFREQAPENNEEYAKVCQMKFGTQFPIFDKIEVNGVNAHPLYVFLKQQQPADQGGTIFQELLLRLVALGEKREGNDIKWNFTKFLINRHGEVIARFAPSTSPLGMVDVVAALL
ncbi:MAG: glutathione peroxidase [Alysiella sp.]|uniref:glutathione peroxidase n=1 Tax=Alysiella sp. TaxID=1872483 RepID=UPI0026DCD34B|nr:glutathione peroxidase [Alysiella sp.]MDO4433713.1 glutathione peroxidase [Alysiella sp.]